MRKSVVAVCLSACCFWFNIKSTFAQWPMYNGDGSYVAKTGDLQLVDDPSEVRLLWKNKLHTGFGKGSEKIIRLLADEGISAFYGGIGSLVVAEGVVVVSFTQPAGEILNKKAWNRYHKLPETSDLGTHPKNLIDGDDVTVALDAKTGEELWTLSILQPRARYRQCVFAPISRLPHGSHLCQPSPVIRACR